MIGGANKKMPFAARYKGDCDNCHKSNPEILVEVHINKNGYIPKIWCLDCLINKGKSAKDRNDLS